MNDHLRGLHVDASTWTRAFEQSDADDRAMALWTLFALHHRGFDGADPDAEWDPTLITVRNQLEDELEGDLRRDFKRWEGPRDFWELIEHDAGEPGLARFVREEAGVEDVLEILRQKSIYHLKESDAHCFVLPRLEPGPKAALAELQYDEFGAGRPDRLHARLFADALDAAGLDPRYGAYVNRAATATLTSDNALTMLCLRRRLRHAAMGHLAAFEATSSLPCTEIVRGLRRLGFDERVVRYYDEHVEADAVHEQLAWRDICGPLIAEDPALEREVIFGAFVCLHLEARAAEEILADQR